MVAVKYNIERKLTYVNASKLLYDNVNHKSTTTAKVSCTFSGYCYDERQNKPDGPRTGWQSREVPLHTVFIYICIYIFIYIYVYV